MPSAANAALVRRVWDGFNQHNRDAFQDLLSEDYLHHDPALPSEMQRGRANYLQGIAMFFTAFPDLHGTIEDMVAEGDRVVTRLRWQGTHQGELMGIPATGNKVDFTMMTMHRVAGGKVVEGWVNFDALGMMRQLGVGQ